MTFNMNASFLTREAIASLHDVEPYGFETDRDEH